MSIRKRNLGGLFYALMKKIAHLILPEPWFNTLGWKVGAWRADRYWQAVKKVRLQSPRFDLFKPGVNVVGYFNAPSGMGESVRILAKAVQTVTDSHALISVSPPPAAMAQPRLSPPRYDVNIIHINPPELPFLFDELGGSFWDGHYNIGFWLWELEEFPPAWRLAFNIFNELWTPSDFISRCLRQSTDLPVTTMPYGLDPDYDPACDRNFFKLPADKFLFLTAADGFSIMERKNPLGAVRAYARAFQPTDTGVGLVVKVRNAPPSLLDQIKTILNGYPNIFYLMEDMNKRQVNSLIKNVDVFVSLHRAEGFGLVLAEAMFLGTPCVATSWSANTEFMDQDTACLVDAKPVVIERTIGPYRKGQYWAEPDVDQAGEYMRRLYLDPSYRQALSTQAQRDIRQKLNFQTMAQKIERRLAQIRSSAGPRRRNPLQ